MTNPPEVAVSVQAFRGATVETSETIPALRVKLKAALRDIEWHEKREAVRTSEVVRLVAMLNAREAERSNNETKLQLVDSLRNELATLRLFTNQCEREHQRLIWRLRELATLRQSGMAITRQLKVLLKDFKI